MLSFSVSTLVFTLINLLVLAVAMRIFLFKPVHKILEERKKLVESSMTEADRAKEEAKALEEKRRTELLGVEEERSRVMHEAQAKATDEYDRIIASAKNEAGKIVKAASSTAELERQEILKQTQSEIADMVVSAAGKVVGGEHSPQADRALLDEFLKKAGEENG